MDIFDISEQKLNYFDQMLGLADKGGLLMGMSAKKNVGWLNKGSKFGDRYGRFDQLNCNKLHP